MTPNNIVNMALLKELDVIALTDHNSCKNLEVTATLAKEAGLLFVPGVEVQTKEEVHLLCYFPSLTNAMDFDRYLDEYRLLIPNNINKFGQQSVMNERGEQVDEFAPSLLFSIDKDIEEIVTMVRHYRGVVVPAHINKSTNSILVNLGFIPPELCFHTVELFGTATLESLNLKGYQVLRNSDAHYLAHISEPVNYMPVKERSVQAVLDYIRGDVLGER